MVSGEPSSITKIGPQAKLEDAFDGPKRSWAHLKFRSELLSKLSIDCLGMEDLVGNLLLRVTWKL